MKKAILACLLCATLFSCKTQDESTKAIIDGQILSGDIKEVKFEWIQDDPFKNLPDHYTATVDSDGHFSIDIPLERLAYGKITSGRFFHDIFLSPGDKFSIKIDADTIVYKGKGAEKNNFMYALEEEKLTMRLFYEETNKGKLPPNEFAVAMQDFKKRRLDFLNSYSKKHKLSKEFTDFFKIQNEVVYENIIRRYPRRYAYLNKIPVDSLELSEEFKKINQIGYFMDDSKVVSVRYLHSLRNLVFTKAKELMPDKPWKDAVETILTDSLNGKTREYVMAKWLCISFGYDKFDTVIYNKFQEIATDSIPIKAVEESLGKFKEKRNLIGKPLRPEFTQTAILDTSNTELTFGQVMEQNKGNVIYLDIWGLGCGPCRATMPYSKKMKEKLKDYPIKFIYLTTDNTKNKGVWEMVFKATFSREGQYSFMNGFNAKLLRYMGINYVPCYMIFDKKGNLINYNADRPTSMVENTQTSLEKTLIELAQK